MPRRNLTPRRALNSGHAVAGHVSTPADERSSRLLFAALLIVLAVEYGGITQQIPLLKALRFATILNYGVLFVVLARIGVGDFFARPQVKILIAFTVLTALSILWAVVSMYALESIRPTIDHLALALIVAALVDRPTRVNALSAVLALTCCFLVAVNFEKLVSGVRAGSFKAGYFMGDGNDFAWGLVVCLPLILHLVLGTRGLLVRLLGLLGVVSCLFGIVGTGSRGAALGLLASTGFYWLVLSQRKMLGAVAIAGVAVAALILAPSTYFDRMASVTNYSEDSSAQGRLQAWRSAVRMAVDFPLGVGAGNFGSAYGRFYMPPIEKNQITYAPGRWLSAHSIYFRTLGEYGFVGLALLLSVLWFNVRDNFRSRRTLVAAGHAARISPTWPGLLNMSMIGYAVCGVFLGGVSYPHLYILTALAISATRLASPGNTRLSSPLRPAGRRRGHRT